MRRLLLVSALALAPPALAARPPAITTAAVHWTGAEGQIVHGYMAIPAKARGRQPTVLVMGDAAAGGQAGAHALAEALARAGFLACTPRGDERLADLTATLAWLQEHRYGTGAVAIVAVGGVAALRASEIGGMAHRPPAAILVLAEQSPPPGAIPTLGLPPLAPGAPLPPAAATFLKEHLR